VLRESVFLRPRWHFSSFLSLFFPFSCKSNEHGSRGIFILLPPSAHSNSRARGVTSLLPFSMTGNGVMEGRALISSCSFFFFFFPPREKWGRIGRFGAVSHAFLPLSPLFPFFFPGTDSGQRRALGLPEVGFSLSRVIFFFSFFSLSPTELGEGGLSLVSQEDAWVVSSFSFPPFFFVPEEEIGVMNMEGCLQCLQEGGGTSGVAVFFHLLSFLFFFFLSTLAAGSPVSPPPTNVPSASHFPPLPLSFFFL